MINSVQQNYGKQQVGVGMSLDIAKNICNRDIIKEIPALKAAAKNVDIAIFADLNTAYSLPYYGDQVWVVITEKMPF